MTTLEPDAILTRLLLKLREQLDRSEPFREIVALIGQCLVAEAAAADQRKMCSGDVPSRDESTPAHDPATLAIATHDEAATTPAARTDEAPTIHDDAASPVAAGTVPLRLGNQKVEVRVPGTIAEIDRARSAAERATDERGPNGAESPELPFTLELVEQRCRLKAASCRHAVEMQISPFDHEALLVRLNKLIAQAKTVPGCYLWTLNRRYPRLDESVLGEIGESYDALADAAALMAYIDQLPSKRRDDEQQALHLLAEADSALRIALLDTWFSDREPDQNGVHAWLKRETTARGIYVRRHMRVDDPADPAAAAELRTRIAEVRRRIDARAAFGREVDARLKKIRYHARQIAAGAEANLDRHWRTIAQTVEKLIELGVTVTDRRIFDAIGPEAWQYRPVGSQPELEILDSVPDGAFNGLAEAAVDPDESHAQSRWSDNVLRAREWLAGGRVVIIGGEPRVHTIEQFRDAFALRDVEWVELVEHGRGEPMRAPIQHPDTQLVLVIVKLTGHLHAEEAREYARRAGKPCIMVTAGYNAEVVAHEILEQASERLATTNER